MEKDP